MPRHEYTAERLRAAAAESRSVAGVLRHLGIPPGGGTHAQVTRQLSRHGVDIRHFTGGAHNRGGSSWNAIPPGERLVLLPPGSRRVSGRRLRQALIATGRAYRCASCGLGDRWNDRPLILHVDHVDGRWWDCRPGNLRFLCPSCHSQTGTYARGGVAPW
jgi:hypothetical protein